MSVKTLMPKRLQTLEHMGSIAGSLATHTNRLWNLIAIQYSQLKQLQIKSAFIHKIFV